MKRQRTFGFGSMGLPGFGMYGGAGDLVGQEVGGRNTDTGSSNCCTKDPCAGPDWLQDIPVRIPEAMLVKEITRMPDIGREEIRLLPKNGSYGTGTGNTEIIFEFPTNNPIDFRGGFIQMLILLSGTGGTYIRLHQGAHVVINQVRVQFGDYDDTLLNYNRIYSFLWNSMVEPAVQSTIGYDLLGFGLQADRNTWGADPNGTSYVIPFFHGLLRRGVFPVHALSRGKTMNPRITLYLDQPNNVLETDKASPQISITALRWHYDEIRSCGARYEAELQRIVNAGSFAIGYNNFYLYTVPIPLSNPADVIVNYKENAINWIDAFFYDASSTSNPLVNDKFITWNKALSNGALPIQYQVNINSKWLPVEPIDTTNDAYRAYVAYLKQLGIWKMDSRLMKHGAPIGLTSFNLSQFIMVYDFRTNVSDWLNITDVEPFNNVNTAINTTPMTWRIAFNISPPLNANIAFIFCSNVYSKAVNGILRKVI